MRWLRLMLAATVANGFGLMGTKLLAESSFGATHQYAYLLAWYASGCVAALLYSSRNLSWPSFREVAVGAAMASMSFAGSLCLVISLSYGTPGYLVYPISSCANVLVVALLGALLFRERTGVYGAAGIACGLLSVLMLSLP